MDTNECTKSQWEQVVKYAIGLLIVVGVRMIPHVPNVEPITATLMPYAKRWGMWSGAIFGGLSVFIYDMATGTLGVWSLFTGGAYVLLGLLAGLYFARVKDHGVLSYVGFAILGTLFFDAVTGLTVGPLFFGQPFMDALMGQIPFTISHLASNIVLAAVVSPLIYKFIVANPKLELASLRQALAR